MNKKGFAVSIIVYLVVFLIVMLLYILLKIEQGRYEVNDGLRTEVIDNLNDK